MHLADDRQRRDGILAPRSLDCLLSALEQWQVQHGGTPPFIECPRIREGSEVGPRVGYALTAGQPEGNIVKSSAWYVAWGSEHELGNTRIHRLELAECALEPGILQAVTTPIQISEMGLNGALMTHWAFVFTSCLGFLGCLFLLGSGMFSPIVSTTGAIGSAVLFVTGILSLLKLDAATTKETKKGW